MAGRALRRLAPSAVTLIRIDHARVLTALHQYDPRLPGRVRRALAETVALSLEIHAAMEEEVFYRAMAATAPDVVGRNETEQREWAVLIADLRQADAADPAFDAAFMQLAADVLSHVAEEETRLLPLAQRVLGSRRLSELGAQMLAVRARLTAPRVGAIITSTMSGFPVTPIVATAGAVTAGAYLACDAAERLGLALGARRSG